jgi:simple sugar transport system permease protein
VLRRLRARMHVSRLNRDVIDQVVLYGMFAVVIWLIQADLGSDFFNRRNLVSILEQIPEFTLFALAMGLTMISGGIDLSVIAMANLSAVLAAEIMTDPGTQAALGSGGAIAVACAVAVAGAALMGLLNGAIIVYCGIPALLATLGTMMLFSGLGVGLTGGVGITGMPPEFVNALSAKVYGVFPVSFVVIAAVFAAASAYMRSSLFGKTLYLYGENRIAALFSGLRIQRALIRSYVISGVLAGLAGLIMLARFNSMKMGFGDAFLLQAILVAVLSGIDPYGGKGRLFNLLVTVLLLQCVQNAFTIKGFSPYAKKMIWGGLLLLFMAMNYLLGRFVERTLSASAIRKQEQGASREPQG